VSAEAITTLRERVEALEATVVALTEQNTQLAHERERYHTLYVQLLEINQKLERGLLGQKAERLPADEAQLTLQLVSVRRTPFLTRRTGCANLGGDVSRAGRA